MENTIFLKIVIVITAAFTIFSIIVTVLFTYSLITTGSTGITNINGNLFLIYSYITSIFEIISFYGLWRMRRWGYYLYIITYIISLISLSLLSGSFKFITNPILLIVVSTLYFGKLKGRNEI